MALAIPKTILAWLDAQPEQVTCAACGEAGSRHTRMAGFRFSTRQFYCAVGPCAEQRCIEYAAGRKAVLLARPKDCARCGKRPHTFLVAGWRLCGRCKTATMREHHQAQAKAGVLAIFATAPLVNTSTWATQNGRSAP